MGGEDLAAAAPPQPFCLQRHHLLQSLSAAAKPGPDTLQTCQVVGTLFEGVWRADVRSSEMGQILREAPNAVVAAVATAGAALHWEGLGTKAAAICRYRARTTVKG